MLLSTPDLVRPIESNSNHVLNRNLVNQKPGWGDSGEERREQIGNEVDQNSGIGIRIPGFCS